MKTELQQISDSVLFDEPLARHTSVRIGGPADAFVYPKTIDELSSLVQWARRHDTPNFVLGAGSNILVREQGIRGLVIHLSQGFQKLEVEKEESSEAILYAEAGVGLPRLVEFCAEEGLAGLEVLSGVPGNVGGGLVMNAGTQEGDISKTVLSVTWMDKEGKVQTWPAEKIRYSYRESHFPRGAIILSARFRLIRKSTEWIRGKIQQYRAYRLETQPLNVPSLGSVFKNYQEKNKKLFAAKLIEDTGLKNVRVGGARISPKHANWIVNEGEATSKDVLALVGLVRDKVKEKFGILLEPEVRVVGEE